MDFTAIKDLDFRDLNHALVAAIMAQQIERERHSESELVPTRGRHKVKVLDVTFFGFLNQAFVINF